MIDVKDLSENPDKFRASQRARGADESVVDAIISADAARRAALIRFENLRAEQNVFGKKVAQAKGEEKQALLAEVKVLAARSRRPRLRPTLPRPSRRSCSGPSPT